MSWPWNNDYYEFNIFDINYYIIEISYNFYLKTNVIPVEVETVLVTE